MFRLSKISLQSVSRKQFAACSRSVAISSKPSGTAFTHRCFSQSATLRHSHPDFEPQKKTPSDNYNKRLDALQAVIKKDIEENDVILYMKGTPTWPACGFSRAVVQILDSYNIKYASRDMVADMEMKEALKVYSNWPTIPQFYVRGEFIGGCDIVMQMHKEGELEALFEGLERKEKKKRDLTEKA